MEDKLAQKWQRQSQEASFNGQYWWVTGVVNGKRFLYGPEYSKEAAENLGLKESNVAFETFPTTTKDKGEARQRIAAVIAKEQHNLPDALKRFRRKPVYKNEH